MSYPNGDVKPVTDELGSYSNYGMGITSDGITMVADVMEMSSQLWKIGIDGKSQNNIQLTSGDADGGIGLTSLPSGEIIYSRRNSSDYDLWKISDSNGKSEGIPITNDAFRESEPVATRDGKSIVFASNREGNSHLFQIDRDGLNLKQLTFGIGSESSPDISPDGNWIVYSNQNKIWKIPVAGGDSFQLTDYDCISPSISPNGKLIACSSPSESRGKRGKINIASFETGIIIKSFDVLTYDYYYCASRWTPDGKAIVFRRTDDKPTNLWKQSISGGEPTQLTDFKSDIIFNYAITTDGKSIVISRGTAKASVVLLKNFIPG
jgi:Tol biopolymer transport system component